MATVTGSLPTSKTALSEKATILWFGGLLMACYAPLLAGLVRQWASGEDMGHGFFVPLVAGFIAWRRRSELAAVQPVPNFGGLALAIWGAVQMVVGTLAAQTFVARTAFLASLAGAVLFLGGTRALKILAFPLFLLMFMFPIPAIIYARLTLPLQLFASSVAETILNLAGVPVLRDGNVLELASQRLSVVEACSGIRSLVSLAFLALVYAYFFDRRIWMRWLLLAATIPIAIAANAARVTLMGLIGEYSTDLAQGFLHLAEGWVLFMLALVLLVIFHRLVNRVHAAGSRGARTRAGARLDRDPARQSLPHKSAHVVLSVVLIAQGTFFYGLSRPEPIPLSKPLSRFPSQIGVWRMIREGVMEQDVKDALRAHDYLTRDYAGAPGQIVNLFVAFFKSQRAGQTPHSPKNCLPGSGWVWTVSDTIPIAIPGRAAPVEINRYIVSKGEEKALVLYWYQSRDRVVASEYKAAAFVAWDALRYNRTDTALVRIVTPIAGRGDNAATQTGAEFIQAVFATLRQFFPA